MPDMRGLHFAGRRLSLTIEPWCVLVLGALALSSRGPSDGFPLSATALLFAALLLSLLIHEGGHAGAVLWFGGNARIRLHAFGGETANDLKLSAPRQFLLTAAGPLAGFAAMGVSYALMRRLIMTGHLVAAPMDFLGAMIRINFFWSAVNLLPVIPMDGGRLLAIILMPRFGVRGLKFVYGVGVVLGGALALYGFASGQLLTAATFGLFAANGVNAWRALARRTPQDDDPALQAEVQEAETLANAGRDEEAKTRLIALRARAGRGRLYEVSTELLGRVQARNGARAEAVELLTSVEPQLVYSSRITLLSLLAESGAHARALAVGRALFPQKTDPYVAYVCACACMGLDDRDGALGWLKTALRCGLKDAPKYLRDPAFAPLRSAPDFDDLERRARGA